MPVGSPTTVATPPTTDSSARPANTAFVQAMLTTARPKALRRPIPTDDATAGHAAGDLWLDPASGGGAFGRLWQAQTVTGGKARWAPIWAQPRPLDVVGSALCAFGTKLLRTAYAGGNCLQITRASDSTTVNVGFLSDGSLDVATADAFVAGTTGNITTWYDQSGNGYNATAAVANAPIWNPTTVVNGARAVTFHSNPNAIANVTTGQRYLTISSSASWTPSTSTLFCAGSVLNSMNGGKAASGNYILTNSAGSKGWLNSYTYTQNGLMAVGGGWSSSTVTELQPSVFGVASSAASTVGWEGNKSSSSAYASGATAYTGPVIGASASTLYANMDLTAFVLWGSSLSTTNQTAVRASLMSLFGIQPQYDDIVVTAGDSQVTGDGSSLNNSWPKLMIPLLSRPCRVYNIAKFGDTAAYMAGTAWATQIAAVYQSTARNFVVVIQIGANDIRASTALATIEANIQALISTAHGLGGNVKVLLCTYPLQADIYANGTENTALQGLNNWIYGLTLGGGGSNPDGIVDLFADPTIGPGVYTSSPFTGFPNTISPDGQHPTDYAMSFYAPIAAAAVSAIVN